MTNFYVLLLIIIYVLIVGDSIFMKVKIMSTD